MEKIQVLKFKIGPINFQKVQNFLYVNSVAIFEHLSSILEVTVSSNDEQNNYPVRFQKRVFRFLSKKDSKKSHKTNISQF